jgi:hypothetical protein
MKRFMWFCLGLALATALLINTGCATLQNQRDPLNILQGVENELKVQAPQDQRKVGWFVQDDDGYLWEYRARARYDNIQVLATCEYTYMRVSGVEKWRGTYYGTPTDMYWNDPPVARLDNLVGCFNWVNHHMNGDQFI